MWNLDVCTSQIRRKFNIIYAFCSYWYMRYLLVTELYIVEPWERALIHILVMVFLYALFYALSSINACLIGFLDLITNYQRDNVSEVVAMNRR